MGLSAWKLFGLSSVSTRQHSSLRWKGEQLCLPKNYSLLIPLADVLSGPPHWAQDIEVLKIPSQLIVKKKNLPVCGSFPLMIRASSEGVEKTRPEIEVLCLHSTVRRKEGRFVRGNFIIWKTFQRQAPFLLLVPFIVYENFMYLAGP